MPPTEHLDPARAALRRQLLAARQAWADTSAAQEAQAALTAKLQAVIAQVEPEILGVFWPLKGEFNPSPLALWAQTQLGCRLALPRARKSPVAMDFVPWDGDTPTTYDEWGIPSPEGKPLVPDVLIVPCLGYTPAGFRLGYGGGYYDRYLAKHPEICAFGAGWDEGLLAPTAFSPAAHDQALVTVFTPSHTWGE
ncbi:MAG: hypothetical protein RI907_698 [Pseudomonadota bacterium]